MINLHQSLFIIMEPLYIMNAKIYLRQYVIFIKPRNFDTADINSFKHQRRKKAEFANSVDLDEVAHNEPPHLDLHCLPSSL